MDLILEQQKRVQQGSGFNQIPQEYTDYLARITTDGGTMENETDTASYIKMLKTNNLFSDSKFIWFGQAASKIRSSGVFKYASKLYDIKGATNDCVQTTTTKQFFFAPKIANNEKNCALNVYKDGVYMTHPQINYAAGSPWSYCFMGNINDTANVENLIAGGESVIIFSDNYQKNITIRFKTGSGASITAIGSESSIGKNRIFHVVYNGSSVLIYVDGILKSTTSASSRAFDFMKYCIGNQYNQQYELNGRRYVRRIQDNAMTSGQVLAEATFLKSIYPEVETVTIGGKIFTTLNSDIIQGVDSELIVGSTQIADGRLDAAWTPGTLAWSFHPTSLGVLGKLYNKAGRDRLVNMPPLGYHVATEAELTALSLLGGNALKATGTNYWNTAGGTNTSGFSAVGSASRNADGSYNTYKDTASFWCADSDKVLKLYHNSDVAEIIAANANDGHAIRFVKNNTLGIGIGDSVITDYLANSVPSYVYSATEIINGNKIINNAVAGHTIASQKTALFSRNDLSLYDYFVLEVGNNDLGSKIASVVLTEMQDLIDSIYSVKKSNAKIIVAKLAYNNGSEFVSFNNGIPNLLRVDAFVSSHQTTLLDVDGTLKAEYRANAGDAMHPNNSGKQIIATAWRNAINTFFTI